MKNSLKHLPDSWVSTKAYNDLIDVLNELDIPEETAKYIQEKLRELFDDYEGAREVAMGEDI